MKKIILASTSPQRKVLMEMLYIPFEIIGSNYEEDMTLNLTPDELVKELSAGKAMDVAKRVSEGIVIGGDSIVAIDNEVIGKPHTVEKAREILRKMSRRSHSVWTGITLIDTETKKEIRRAVETKVYFKELTDEEIENYIKKDNPLKNAGGYKIQSLGAVLVEKIEGDYSNVVGFPLFEVSQVLKEFGVNII